jgi:uncharacterized protein (TIGR02147 family)
MNLFETKSVRAFLKDKIERLPRRGRGEASRIAKHLGISSTLMSHILSGARQLTVEQGELVTDYFSFSALETDFFLFQLQFERAGTSRLQAYWRKKLEKVRAESKILVNRIERERVFTESEKAVFYSSAIYSAVRLYTSTHDRGRALDEISRRFSLSRAHAGKIIAFLMESGLVEERGGYFRMGPQSTHLEKDSPHVVKHHTNWRLKALQSAESLGDSELMFTSPASLSREDFESLRERMVLFIKDYLKTAQASPAEEVACFNLDFFWVRA